MTFKLRRSPSLLARLVMTSLLSVWAGWCQESWITAFRAGRLADALDIADRQLKTTPSDAALWTERGLALSGLGRKDESIKSFQRALELKPTFIPALEGAAEVAYKSQDPQAEKFVARLLAIDSRNSTAHAMAGVLAFERKDCKMAAQHFEQAGPELARNQQAYSLFGACLLESNKPEKAATVFSNLLKQFPESVNVRYNLGYAQFLSGSASEAIETLRPLNTVEHPDAPALNLIASAEAASGQLSAALDDLRTAAKLKPEAEENYLDFATLCLEHESPELAEEIVNIGIQNIPDSARLYSMRGIIRAQKGNAEESTVDFEQANRLTPDKSYGSVGLSMLYAGSKRPDEAERILRERLRAAPQDATLNYLLADVLLNRTSGVTGTSPNLAEIRTMLLRSIAARPDFSNAHALLGKVYRQSGDNAGAIKELKLALSYDPRNRVALNHLVSVLRETGKQQEAATYAASLKRILQQEIKTDMDQSRVRIVRVE